MEPREQTRYPTHAGVVGEEVEDLVIPETPQTAMQDEEDQRAHHPTNTLISVLDPVAATLLNRMLILHVLRQPVVSSALTGSVEALAQFVPCT